MTHEYNEARKRFEPVSKMCSFCQKEEVSSFAGAHSLEFHSIVDQSNMIVYKTTKYKKTSIVFARCPSCRSIHSKIDKQAHILTFLLPVLALGIFIYIWGLLGMIFGFIISVIFSLLIYQFASDILEKRYNIATVSEVQIGNPTIDLLLGAGWRIGPPMV